MFPTVHIVRILTIKLSGKDGALKDSHSNFFKPILIQYSHAHRYIQFEVQLNFEMHFYSLDLPPNHLQHTNIALSGQLCASMATRNDYIVPMGM